MMSERLSTQLESIARAASRAVEFLADMQLESFAQDAKTQAAVAMCLVVIGEGANRVVLDSPDFVAAHPDWPWDQMRGLRNRIVHGYDSLNAAVIWSTVTDFVPQLLLAISAARDPGAE